MKKFHKTISLITAVCFYLASTPAHAALPPLSLSQMYGYASSGNVRALRAAVQRGLNIDVTDRNGNTGLCHAILRNDTTAYNAFRAAGANPRHGCTTNNIPRRQYEAFMNTPGVAEETATPRGAYAQFGEGEYVISKGTWIAGGLLLIAAGAGIALAGGGGGGGGAASNSYIPTDDSLAGFAGTLAPSEAAGGYRPVLVSAVEGETKTNSSTLAVANDNYHIEGSLNELIGDFLEFNENILTYAKYIKVGMKTVANGMVINDGTITLSNAAAGLSAVGGGASAINNDLIQMVASNGSIGMIAGESATATNADRIRISFGGKFDSDQIIGMYADTGATITNWSGTIETYTSGVSDTAKAGKIIGMEGRLINQEQSPNPANATKLINSNSASIRLSMTGDTQPITTNLIGMGSFIDRDFINGTKLISRAGFVDITNNGLIDLTLSLINGSTYTRNNLRKNSGGIIGILADANTTATNGAAGNININVQTTNDGDVEGGHAGMLSKHGGSITNAGTITLTGGTSGYGMIAIRGEGSNAEFDNRKPTLINTGTINIDSVGGYGMTSFHGGTITNSNIIHMLNSGSPGTDENPEGLPVIGIHSNAGTVANSGGITLDQGGIGIDISRNKSGEGSTNYDTANTKVTNSGTITVNNADIGSHGIKSEYGTVENTGDISLVSGSTVAGGLSGIYAKAGKVNNSGSIYLNVNNTSTSDGINSDSAEINNLASGEIELSYIGGGIHTVSGKVTNDGKITLQRGGVGIVSTNGNITNNGDIIMNAMAMNDQGIGISTQTGIVTNKKNITITSNNSTGIESVTGGIVLNDTGGKISVTGVNGRGIYMKAGGRVTNNGDITITNTASDGTDHYGINAAGNTSIINNSNITLTGLSSYGSSVNTGYGINAEKGTIYNNGIINIDGFYGYGIKTDGGIATNQKKITMNNGGYGMHGGAGSSLVNDTTGTISIGDVKEEDISYGMYTEGGTARNAGEITIGDKKSYGIYVDGGEGINGGTIELTEDTSDESTGMYAASGTLRNTKYGVINISGDDSYGVKMEDGTFTNEGTINLKGENGYGIYSTSGTIHNRGTITNTGSGNTAIYTKTGIINNYVALTLTQSGTAIEVAGAGTANNYDTIKVPDGSAMVGSDSGKLINTTNGKIEMGTGVGMDVTGSGSAATNNGSITFTGSSGVTAMKASDGATADNTKTIKLADGVGMSAVGKASGDGGSVSKVYNNGTITSAGTTNVMETDVGEAYNNGTITLTGTNALGMYTTAGIIENTSSIEMNNGGTGMKVVDTRAATETRGTARNSGTIKTASTTASYGMYTQGGALINETTGLIDLNVGTGMYATGSSAIATNDGSIKLTGTSSGSYGIAAYTGAKVTNSVTGTITGGLYAMYASGVGSEAKNQGTLTKSSGILMYADNGTIINDADGKLDMATGTTAMYATGSGGSATNNGAITMTSGSYGMFAENGASITNGLTGTINIGGGGTEMYAKGSGSKAKNLGNLTHVSAANGEKAMFAENGGVVQNEGNITLESSGTLSGGIGMLARGAGSQAINKKTITNKMISGVGMKAEAGGLIVNDADGTIQIEQSSGYGMWADGAGSKIRNEGKIIVASGQCEGEDCETDGDPYIHLTGGATFDNNATFTTFSAPLNFNSFSSDGTGKVVLGNGGTFEAPELSGTVYAGSSIVEDGFETTYRNEDSFVGEDAGIDLQSDSYMFNAGLETNEKGETDVVMEMKEFGDIVSNSSVSEFLAENYASDKGESLFRLLKNANNQNNFDRLLNNQLGLDFFPSFARQNIEVIKSLNRQMNNSVFMNNDPREVTAMMGYDFVSKDQERSGVVEGYEEDAQSVYGLVEKKYNNNFSYGAGVTLTKVDSKYDNNSNRDEVLVHVLAPVKYKGDGYTLVSMPRIGYGWGDYERNASGTVYEADTKSYYYGITNEARKDIDLGFFTLEPTAEFNVLGIYQDRIKERNQLTIKSNNSLSVEGGLGLYARKSWEIDENNSFGVRLGGTFYQEFGDTYGGARAEMSGMGGSYKMKGYETDKSRGVVTGRADYNYVGFNFYGEASKTIERDDAYEFKLGVSVNF